MKNKIMLIVGLVLMVVGCIVGYFANLLNDIPALVTSVAGCALIILSTWNKSEKKPVTIISIICIVFGTVALVFSGVGEKTVSTLVVAIIGVVSLIAGIILSNQKKLE